MLPVDNEPMEAPQKDATWIVMLHLSEPFVVDADKIPEGFDRPIKTIQFTTPAEHQGQEDQPMSFPMRILAEHVVLAAPYPIVQALLRKDPIDEIWIVPFNNARHYFNTLVDGDSHLARDLGINEEPPMSIMVHILEKGEEYIRRFGVNMTAQLLDKHQ